ncbi:MAG TPA: CheR family methyltransferase [Acidothermaceae bacterium]
MADSNPPFERLLTFLKENRGFDFTGYKRTSLMRRVDRQMQIVAVSTYEEYQDFLEVHPEEFTALFNTILINVTGFFRDPDAWTYLTEEFLPKLLRDKPREALRLWSAGCASGEEAYSLAITLAELMGPADFRNRVKIYATDVDEDALAYARQATYTDRQLTGLDPAQIEKYFEPVGGKRAFRKDLRRAVIFGRNDLVQDAPISRTDLLVCRNTLMYFNAEQQSRILQRLHFALNPAGVLFLGKAEMLLSHTQLFEPVDLKRRFFRKTSAEQPRDRALFGAAGRNSSGGDIQCEVALLAQEAVVNSPIAHVVVEDDGTLALVNQRAESVFNVTQRDIGRPFQDLELSYRPLELRSYIAQASTDRHSVWVRDVELARPGGEVLYFDVQVVPLQSGAGADLGVSIFFTDVTRYRQLQDELEYANRQLETAYEELQSTNEELETTNEELQSTVEELETTNEELQSTNEELETMNEELQSMNDELQSSNDELRERTTEVSELNRFMESILSSLRAAVAVTDRDLKLLVWNERAADLWGLRREEVVGQHLLNLDIGLPVERLRPIVRRVLSDGAVPPDEDVHIDAINRRGRPVTVRVTASPLRGGDGEINGVILVLDPEEQRVG